MPTETLNEILMRVAMTYTGDTTGYPFNEAMRRAAQFYLDGGGVSPAYVADRWYPTGFQATTGSVAAATGLVRLYAFTVRRPVTISTLLTRVITTGAGSFQLAIYANDAATMRPTGTVLARTGDMLSTSAAPVSADITGDNVELSPGVYWAAVNVDATSATAVFQGLQLANTMPTGLVGALTEATATGSSTTALLTLTTPMAYNTWSTMTGATFTEVVGASGIAHIWFKAA